jgi:4'-phosphopantetheinyl transferase
VLEIWRADVRALGDEQLRWLNGDERARMARFRDGYRGLWWGRTRGVLRLLLGRYLQLDPCGLVFASSAHGKPVLDGPLSFSVSHSRGVSLYAIAAAGEVGVDIERRARALDSVALATRLLGSERAQHLSGLAEPERHGEFLRMWSTHEARAKCLGTGLGHATGEHEPSIWTRALRLEAGSAGAVAASHTPRELRCWEWTESA